MCSKLHLKRKHILNIFTEENMLQEPRLKFLCQRRILRSPWLKLTGTSPVRKEDHHWSGSREKPSGLTLGQPPPSCGTQIPSADPASSPCSGPWEKQKFCKCFQSRTEPISHSSFTSMLKWVVFFYDYLISIQLTKNCFGGFLPLRSVQRSQNRTLLQACSYNRI